MSIRIALIVSAPLEMTLTAGREELSPASPATVSPEEDLPFINVGRHQGQEIHLNGPLIGDPDLPGHSLSVAWYFPGEEKADRARTVDLAEAKIFLTTAPRHRAEPGWQWRYRLETRRPFQEIHFFSQGFQPPFKPSDISLHIQHLINFNYDGYLLTKIEWNGRPAAEVETEWRFPTIEDEGILED